MPLLFRSFCAAQPETQLYFYAIAALYFSHCRRPDSPPVQRKLLFIIIERILRPASGTRRHAAREKPRGASASVPFPRAAPRLGLFSEPALRGAAWLKGSGTAAAASAAARRPSRVYSDFCPAKDFLTSMSTSSEVTEGTTTVSCSIARVIPT